MKRLPSAIREGVKTPARFAAQAAAVAPGGVEFSSSSQEEALQRKVTLSRRCATNGSILPVFVLRKHS